MFQRILIAVDEREPTGVVVEVGANLALTLGARVALVHVVDPTLAAVPEGGISAVDLLDDLRQAGRALLQTIGERLPDSLSVETFLREGKPAAEIMAVAREWRSDLIVIGAHKHSALAHLFGSTMEEAVHEAPCPVLAVPAHRAKS